MTDESFTYRLARQLCQRFLLIEGAKCQGPKCGCRIWTYHALPAAQDIVKEIDRLRDENVKLRTWISAHAETAEDAANDVISSVDYLQDSLNNGNEIYESKWLDSLMSVHGVLLSIVEDPVPGAH